MMAVVQKERLILFQVLIKTIVMTSEFEQIFVSVIIRSYNRLQHVLEILSVCAEQDYDKYEVVIIEQSTNQHWNEYKEKVEKYSDIARVIRSKPLGPPGARNVGVAHSLGNVVLFIDDDDLPVGNNWVSGHAKNYKDPACIGVGGKHIHSIGEKNRYKDNQKAYDRCLSLSFLLHGRVFTGINKVKKPVEWLHGNNCSIRKNTIIKLGGWYPFIDGAGEEHSLFYKFQNKKISNEYLMFNPEPTVYRRFNIAGGVARRSVNLRTLLIHRMQYYHWVISTHFPIRFYCLYPIFMLYGFKVSTRYLRKNSSYEHVFLTKLFGPLFGQKIYFLMEFIHYPILVIKYLLKKKPHWDGILRQV